MDFSLIVLSRLAGDLTRERMQQYRAAVFSYNSEIIILDAVPVQSLEILGTLASNEHYIPVHGMKNHDAYAAGLRIAGGEFVLCCNAGLMPNIQSIQTALSYLRHNESVSIVGPALRDTDGIVQSYYRFGNVISPLYQHTFLGRTWMGKRHLQYLFMRDMPTDGPADVDWVHGDAYYLRLKDYKTLATGKKAIPNEKNLCRLIHSNNKRVSYVPAASVNYN